MNDRTLLLRLGHPVRWVRSRMYRRWAGTRLHDRYQRWARRPPRIPGYRRYVTLGKLRLEWGYGSWHLRPHLYTRRRWKDAFAMPGTRACLLLPLCRRSVFVGWNDQEETPDG